MIHLKIVCFIPVLGFVTQTAFAQTAADSSVNTLAEVPVSAFAQTRWLRENPSAMSVIGKEALARYGNINLLPALNSAPGVRMEERSPGSYRLNIRGSSLRAPFGVRNVKVYYDDIPITDPGGFTYFNLLGFGNVRSVQVLKGPSGSLYGQGNGGVLLIGSMPETFEQGVSAGTSAGSYQLNRNFAEARVGDSTRRHIIRYEHIDSKGYREQSVLRKRILSYDGLLQQKTGHSLAIHALYNKLNYETPGALTQKEYEQHPSGARPAIGPVPGAVQQDARIIQENLLLGVSAQNKLGRYWQGKTTLYGLYTRMDNAAIRNYSETTDPHVGGRATLSYHRERNAHVWNGILGVEVQQSIGLAAVYGNNKGVRDTLQTKDELRAASALAFMQGSWQYKKWTVEGGACLGRYSVFIDRVVPLKQSVKRPAQLQLSPRLAVLYRLDHAAAYFNVASGYSSPTLAELAPSGSRINTGLLAERGMNYEAGIRGALGAGISYDIATFYYTLSHAIVLRKDSAGGDYYVNSGKTKQWGLEANIEYKLVLQPRSFFRQLKLWMSYTAYHFRYGHFVQETSDFSGKRLPGTPDQTVAGGTDLRLPAHLALHVTYYYSSRIALNDANTAYAAPYQLLGIKCTYQPRFHKVAAELFAGADNVLNQQYSLGNDINAAGGRYFNAAMPLSFYAGIALHWLP